MYKVIIIGCGQLGSRHLQSLCKATFPISIAVVDPFEASLVTAEERAKQVLRADHQVSLTFDKSISAVKESAFDLAVIATNADIRAESFRNLVASKTVKNVLFEKFLFQKKSDYHSTQALLEEKGISAWVNTSRRMFPAYQRWVSEWKEKGPFEYQVDGGAWGLACNMVHHVDFYQAITGARIVSMDFSQLDATPVAAKRKGFFEFFGTLLLKMSDGGVVKLQAVNNDQAPLTRFTFKDKAYVIDEVKGFIKAKDLEEKLVIPFQSELTLMFVEDLQKGKVLLPTYQESMLCHLTLLQGFLEFTSRHGHFADGTLQIT